MALRDHANSGLNVIAADDLKRQRAEDRESHLKALSDFGSTYEPDVFRIIYGASCLI